VNTHEWIHISAYCSDNIGIINYTWRIGWKEYFNKTLDLFYYSTVDFDEVELTVRDAQGNHATAQFLVCPVFDFLNSLVGPIKDENGVPLSNVEVLVRPDAEFGYSGGGTNRTGFASILVHRSYIWENVTVEFEKDGYVFIRLQGMVTPNGIVFEGPVIMKKEEVEKESIPDNGWIGFASILVLVFILSIAIFLIRRLSKRVNKPE
jgi:hypothetical protein